MWFQKQIVLPAQKRGIHIISSHIQKELQSELGAIQIGLLHLFIQHTSASLCINENADPDVRHDIESWLNHTIRENEPWYRHTLEGSDDMPAHIKGIVIGPSLSIPLSQGRMALGTWQGIYLCEHRNRGGARKILATIQGD